MIQVVGEVSHVVFVLNPIMAQKQIAGLPERFTNPCKFTSLLEMKKATVPFTDHGAA